MNAPQVPTVRLPAPQDCAHDFTQATPVLWEDAVRVVYLYTHCGRPLADWPAQAGTDSHSRPHIDGGSLAIGETNDEGGRDD